MNRRDELLAFADTVKGFMPRNEGLALYDLALARGQGAPEQPLDLLFIDGGHARDVAWADFEAWTPRVVVGGLLLIHDVFEDPLDGGRAPFEIYQAALAGGQWSDLASEGSLRALVRV